MSLKTATVLATMSSARAPDGSRRRSREPSGFRDTFLRVTDGVDHARVTARRDDDEAAVLHVIDGGMLALEGISDELARLRLDARRTRSGSRCMRNPLARP